VAGVLGMPVTVVYVVEVVAVGYGYMPAALAVLMVVLAVRSVIAGLALIHVVAVNLVKVAIVHVVHVVTVRDDHMAAGLAVLMRVVGVWRVSGGHDSLRSQGKTERSPPPHYRPGSPHQRDPGNHVTPRSACGAHGAVPAEQNAEWTAADESACTPDIIPYGHRRRSGHV
jgi:hypothetical protein